MNRGRLTAWQLFWVALLTMLPTLVLLLPGELLRLGGRWAWWTPVLAGLPAAGLAWLAGSLAARAGDLLSVAHRALGPVGGRAVLGIAWVAMGAYVVVIVREVGVGVGATFVSGAVPVFMLVLLALIPAGLLAWLGPVVIGRTAGTLTPFLTVTPLAGLLIASPVMHVMWALPLLPGNLDFAAWQPVGLVWLWLVEPAVLGALLMQEVQPRARRAAGRLLAAATASAAALLAVSLWALVADFGPPRAAEFAIPFIHVAQELSYSPYLEHLDTLVMPVEILGGLMKLGIFLWLWGRLTQGLTGLGPPIPLLAELAVAGLFGVVLFPNLLAVDRSLYALARYALPALVACTLLPYGVAALGSRRRSA